VRGPSRAINRRVWVAEEVSAVFFSAEWGGVHGLIAEKIEDEASVRRKFSEILNPLRPGATFFGAPRPIKASSWEETGPAHRHYVERLSSFG